MAKRWNRRPVLYEGDQHGCMSSFISMFDFRHGRTTQRLLSDSKRGSNLVDSKAKEDGTLHSIRDEEESVIAVDAGKPSVKKLMEEEMVNEQDTKKELSNAETETKESNLVSKDEKKNRRKKNKGRSKSCSSRIEGLVADGKLGTQQPSVLNSEEKTRDMVNIDKIMEEFCHQIHQKGYASLRFGQLNEAPEQPNGRNHDMEETLIKAIKVFVRQKLINFNNGTEDENVYSCEEIIDVLQNITPNDELFLKLQGLESVLVKYLQNLCSAHGEKDEFFKSFTRFNLAEHDLHNSQQTGEAIHSKRNFFRRKVKTPIKRLLTEEKSSEVPNRIVVLKPGPTGLRNHESEGVSLEAPKSESVVRNKVAPLFFFSEIKRKLKHAIRKERQQEVSTDSAPRKSLDCLPKVCGEKTYKEHAAMNSPTKEHFFIEKIAKPNIGLKKGYKSGKLKESKFNEIRSSPKKDAASIYTEAKKHLSQMLSNEAEDVYSPSRQVSNTLGRLLSFSEYSGSPVSSPQKDQGQGSLTAEMNQDTRSIQVPTAPKLESQPCAADRITDDKAPAASTLKSSDIDELIHESRMDEAHESISSEGELKIVKPTEAVLEREADTLNSASEPSFANYTGYEQNCDAFGTCGEERPPINKPFSSPMTSPSKSSNTKNVKDVKIADELLKRPSPISVLEPLFSEEEISPAPASMKLQSVGLPVPPPRIQFEELDHLAADQGMHLKSCTDDKESVLNFVSAVLQASGVNWDDFYMKLQSSDQILDPSILDEVEFFPNQLCLEKKLLFDCINNVLVEVFWRYLALGFFSLKRSIRPPPGLKDCIYEVCIGIYWNFLTLPLPHNLERLIKKDMSKSGAWMDLRCDAETIVFELSDDIFDDLLEETVLTSTNAHFKSANTFIAVEYEKEKHPLAK